VLAKVDSCFELAMLLDELGTILLLNFTLGLLKELRAQVLDEFFILWHV